MASAGSSLAGKAILVTGASSGIGADVAIHLASFGSRLSLVARNQGLLEEVKGRCLAAGARSVSGENYRNGI